MHKIWHQNISFLAKHELSLIQIMLIITGVLPAMKELVRRVVGRRLVPPFWRGVASSSVRTPVYKRRLMVFNSISFKSNSRFRPVSDFCFRPDTYQHLIHTDSQQSTCKVNNNRRTSSGNRKFANWSIQLKDVFVSQIQDFRL